MRENPLEWYRKDLISWENAQQMVKGNEERYFGEQIDRDTAVIAAFEALEELQKHAMLALEYVDDEPRASEFRNILITISSRFGYHEDGLGWSPEREFCGECSDYNCIGCPNINTKAEEPPYNEDEYINQLKF